LNLSSKSQAELPTTLHLQSSSFLGTGKAITHQDHLDKLEDKEIRRALDGRVGKRKYGAERLAAMADSEDDDLDGLEEGTGEFMEVNEPTGREKGQKSYGATRSQPIILFDSSYIPPAQESKSKVSPAVGSALQRNADGSIIAPRTVPKKAKSSGTILKKWRKGLPSTQGPMDSDSDSSFDSSDSGNDSDEGVDEDLENEGEDETEGDGGSGDGSSSDEGGAEQEEESPLSKPKRAGFKAWAMSQLSAAKGYVAPVPSESTSEQAPSDPTDEPPPPKKKRKIDPSGEMRGPLGEDFQLPSTSLAQHLQAAGKTDTATKKVVSVTRPADVEDSRLLLPIVAEEQPIIEAILLNSVVIICGETGSGKTTQVPQFLYEAGFGSPGSDNPGMIGVTQPRRVAAMSMASRVAHELSLTSSRVSYQIRYDATVSPSTSIKFMTDGVLLRELATDFLLLKYSVVIIDEAHERSMNTDILIGVLSRVIKLREDMWKEGKDRVKVCASHLPLRLIIMSATLRVNDFAENKTLFATPPPIINVSARQHPVTVHFSRRTGSDYVTEAVRKASKIHSRLPPGGILIFLTGQNEIAGVCRKLEVKFGARALQDRKKRQKAEDIDLGNVEEADLALDVDGQQTAEEDAEALDTDDEEMDEQALGIDTDESDEPMHIIPLYSLLPTDKQMRVFQPPPPGHRLVVVSTNVAETSLTIPGIRYVIDCGRAKERRYNVANGIQSFQISWISKASAAQRAGRAGRTGPGHCYRLYSSAVFENYFDQFTQPEILRMPIEGVVLQMKSMHIDAVVNFPFPTPPDRSTLRQAETVLTHLGAIVPSLQLIQNSSELPNTVGGKITELGRTMSLFPLSPRFSKMLVSGRQHGCLPYVIALVSALSVGDPFLREEAIDGLQSPDSGSDDELSHITSDKMKAKELRKMRRRAFFKSQQLHASLGNSLSDLFKILSVVGAYEYAGGGQKFCAEHFVRPKAMEEIHKLRAQISNIVSTNFPNIDGGFTPDLAPPSDLQLKVLRQLLAAGFIDQVAIRKDLVLKDSASGDQYTTSSGIPYQALGIAEDVYIHPSSVLTTTLPPDFIVFHEVIKTSRVWLKGGCTVINAAWLSSLGKSSLCTFSKPVKNSAGNLVVIPKFGPAGWELPPIKESV
ncbi:hypothetical protein HETIRDRAFT_318995, partial [Heterobasidion irregulare TC 32-1]